MSFLAGLQKPRLEMNCENIVDPVGIRGRQRRGSLPIIAAAVSVACFVMVSLGACSEAKHSDSRQNTSVTDAAAQPADYTPALEAVITAAPDTAYAEMMNLTCGKIHDQLAAMTESGERYAGGAYAGQYGKVRVTAVEQVRESSDKHATAVVTVRAERSEDSEEPLTRKARAEFDTSATPWKICDLVPVS
ncbi:hypothetical protein K7711_42065 [Nocardia sp. CA2R105]|uniref:hypothetical protein n=1 Tax=Nocardia coffeae TaxID=2873381 RepID=UPI001CA671CF|nr:hypothetical protein [Nocardia coffeae]MBY8863114.1 hypothetical protein [Nocardia coffeae]